MIKYLKGYLSTNIESLPFFEFSAAVACSRKGLLAVYVFEVYQLLGRALFQAFPVAIVYHLAMLIYCVNQWIAYSAPRRCYLCTSRHKVILVIPVPQKYKSRRLWRTQSDCLSLRELLLVVPLYATSTANGQEGLWTLLLHLLCCHLRQTSACPWYQSSWILQQNLKRMQIQTFRRNDRFAMRWEPCWGLSGGRGRCRRPPYCPGHREPASHLTHIACKYDLLLGLEVDLGYQVFAILMILGRI